MSYQDCIDGIKAAAGRELSDDDVLGIVEQLQLRTDRLARERVDLSAAELRRAAAEELGAEARMAAAIEARNRKMNALKRIGRRGFYDTAPAMGRTAPVVVGLEAKLVGVNAPFAAGRLSVDAQGKALARVYLGGLTVELERAGLYRAVRDGTVDAEIRRELWELSRGAGDAGSSVNSAGGRGAGRPGVSGNATAREAAAIIHKYQKLAVEGQNREGAWVGHDETYIARTTHDADRIRRAGYEAWRQAVLAELDHERTFAGVEDPERFLRGVHSGLVSGIHLTAEGAQGFKDPAFSGPGNLAKRLSKGRVLHWKDADAWGRYQEAFGTKTLIENVLASLDQAAKNTALMREFGTNPRAEFEADLKFLEESWRDRDLETAEAVKAARRWLSNRFDELDGTARMPVHRLAARIGSGVRAVQSMAKLGGATISAISDVALKAAELRYQGIGLLEAYGDGLNAVLRGRGAGEQREIADLLRAGLDGMVGDIAARFDAVDTPTGTLSKLTNIFFRFSGLTYWTDAQRAGAEMVMSRHLGGLHGTAFAALPEEARRMLGMFGVTPEEWGALGGVELAQAHGRGFLTPDAALKLSDEALEPVVGPRLADLRRRMLERAAEGAAALERLERRLGRLEAILGRDLPTRTDAERAWTKAVYQAWQRQAEAISVLRDRIVQMRDGEASTNQTLKTMRREVADLSKDQRRIAARAIHQVGGILKRIPQAEGRRVAAEAALAALEERMLARIREIEALPDRLAAETNRVRERARQDLALKLTAYFSDRGEYAVIAPGARERAMMRQGTRPGTPVGEALRYIMQFKAFPVAVISKAWGREIHGQAGAGRTAGIVHMMVASAVFGYLAMAAKDLFKGRTPRDPADPKTWAAAFVQGGGAGIYGDYVVGQYSRFGRSMLASLAGPTLGQADDLAELWNRARQGDDMAAYFTRFAVSNTPFANLFYTRAALDYLLLYQVQEALNPGFLRRFERRIRRENNQEFLLRPSAVIGHGGGFR